MRLTVGPHPPAVYWRRRAIVLGAALVLLFLVAQACMASAPADDRASRGSGDEPTPPASVSPAAATVPPSGTGSPAPASGPGDNGGEGNDDSEGRLPDAGAALGPDGCTDDEILVVAEASETTFAVGDEVEFAIRIAHDADRACRRDVGGDHRELRLVRGSGADHVWSSRDCANPTGNDVRRLTTGWESTHHIGFAGLDTSACDGLEAAGRELAPGEYELRARLGTAYSEPVTITLR